MSKDRLEILKEMLFLEQNDPKSFYEMVGYVKGYVHALKDKTSSKRDKRKSADIIQLTNKNKD